MRGQTDLINLRNQNRRARHFYLHIRHTLHRAIRWAISITQMGLCMGTNSKNTNYRRLISHLPVTVNLEGKPIDYLASEKTDISSFSSPLPHPFHPQSASVTPQSEQPLMTSPSAYMINQHAYYFPATPDMPSHPTSISSQPQSMVPEPMYSSPESAAATDSDRPAGVSSLRPRPQCWDHGCNGREFSTFSNLLRHQREKSGVVAKAECPICGAVFTRTTARNIHVGQGKCKSSGRDSSAE
ncbi:hypothetical protein CBS147332_3049 [Penicillium roqueforti]|nr:hypothetical protein CBS147332_3049 [Penicillium roqueforti]KAI3125459.1 hypothetical protein CBS147331_453 [Penicillium roqueforti]